MSQRADRRPNTGTGVVRFGDVSLIAVPESSPFDGASSAGFKQLALWEHPEPDETPPLSREASVALSMTAAGWRRRRAASWIRRYSGCATSLEAKLMSSDWAAAALYFDRRGRGPDEFMEYAELTGQAGNATRWLKAGLDMADLDSAMDILHRLGRTVPFRWSGADVPPEVFGWAGVGLDAGSITILTAVGSAPQAAWTAKSAEVVEQLHAAAFMFSLKFDLNGLGAAVYRRPPPGHPTHGIRFVEGDGDPVDLGYAGF